MSVAACGGGMGDDDKGGDEKKMGKGLALILDLVSSDNDEDENDNDNDKMEEEDEIAKPKKSIALRRLTSPEASHSAKRRRISRHYMGESRSFDNLMEMGIKDARELGKKEHPLNKKRRMLIANENRQKSPLSKIMSRASSLPNFQPMINEEKGEGEGDHDKVEKNKKKKGDDDDSKNQEDGN